MLVAVCGSIVLLVDQHAADERVQLECLQDRLSAQLDAGGVCTTTTVPPPAASAAAPLPPLLLARQLWPPLQLQLPPDEAAALAQHSTAVGLWGWAWTVAPGNQGEGTAADTHQRGLTLAVLLQRLPVLAGVQLGALDLRVGAPAGQKGGRKLP